MNKYDLHNREQQKLAEKVDSHLWIIPFADFMTILMIFFLGLYVLAMSGNKVSNEMMLLGLEETFGGEVGKKKQMAQTAGSIEQSFTSRGLQKLVNVEVDAQRIRIVMASPILFVPGSAEVGEQARPLLSELAGILREIPNRVTVEGHTCDLPVLAQCKYRSNLELSGARAFSVVRFLIEQGKLDPERFVALGCGENCPLKPNDSIENRSLNRRVELLIEK